jgi:hypothetical protein
LNFSGSGQIYIELPDNKLTDNKSLLAAIARETILDKLPMAH